MAETRTREQGQLLNNDITVVLSSGQIFQGWKSITVNKSIDELADSFSIEYDNRFDDSDSLWPLRPGIPIRVNLDGETILTGSTEELSAAFGTSSKTINVSGRSKAGDLIDCSVVPKQFPDTTIDKIAAELVKPYGVSILLSVVPGELRGFTTKPGETVFSALDRAARTLGFLWVSTRGGNIRLTEASKFKGVSSISEDFNMVSGSMSVNNAERFGKYKVIGQSNKARDQGILSTLKKDVTQPTGEATDLGISEVRNLTVVGESNIDGVNATKRAQWEATNRIARGFSLSATVLGWKDESGNIWDINQLIRVKSQTLGLNDEFLTSSVSYSKSIGSGTRATINFVRKDAFIAKPEYKKADDPNGLLGVLKKSVNSG